MLFCIVIEQTKPKFPFHEPLVSTETPIQQPIILPSILQLPNKFPMHPTSPPHFPLISHVLHQALTTSPAFPRSLSPTPNPLAPVTYGSPFVPLPNNWSILRPQLHCQLPRTPCRHDPKPTSIRHATSRMGPFLIPHPKLFSLK